MSYATNYVYLFRCGEAYKIGFSGDPKKRLSSFSSLPDPVELVHSFPQDQAALFERAWHRRFEAKRIRGEWFRLSESDVDEFVSVESRIECSEYFPGATAEGSDSDNSGVTVVEAARRLAVSRPAIYKWIDKGRIRVVSVGERKRGSGLRLNSEDVDSIRAEREDKLRSQLAQVVNE